MSLPAFRLLRPSTIDEAVFLLAKHAGRVRLLAGGTDLIPSMQQQLFVPEYVLDLRGLVEWSGIRHNANGVVEIGALTILSVIEKSMYLREHYPVLAEAAATVASPVLRNMGTIGGNICLDTRCLWYNKSFQWRRSCGFCIKKDGHLCHVAPGGTKCWAAFSGDLPPALLCLNADIEIIGIDGYRRIALRDFYTGDGETQRKLLPTEIVTRVFLPPSLADYRGTYRKLRIRGSIDYPLAGVAAVMKFANGFVEDVQLAITAVNPAPFLVPRVGKILIGHAIDAPLADAVGDLAARTAKPLTTSALTPEYRREMIRVFTRRAVLALAPI